jgi:catechol 2,3-dioxygenase-like lactoylglutathione lyase family enzyme
MIRPPIDQQVTFLYTRDLASTARFYEQTLGLSLALDQGSCRIYRTGGDSFLGFCQRDEAPERPAGIIITLATSRAGVDAWYHRLQEQGCVAEHPPQLNPIYNIYHFFVRDPNGYLLEIQAFLDPRWPQPDVLDEG